MAELGFTCLTGSTSSIVLAGPQANDDQIYDRVRMRLAGDPDVKGGALDISVKDGVVTIKGKVDTEKAKRRAAALAKKVKGVKSVENDLAIGPRTY